MLIVVMSPLSRINYQ